MFNKVKIKNFKIFKFLEISNLSRVNIFFGENNCGKSTLLEGLFVLSGITNPELFLRINHFRDYDGIRDLTYFFHDFDSKKYIELSGQGIKAGFTRDAVIKFSIDDAVKKDYVEVMDGGIISSNKPFNKFIVNANIENDFFSSDLAVHFFNNKEHGTFRIGDYKELISCNYLSPTASFQIIYSMLRKIVEDKQEKMVISALKNIDSRIKDFQINGADILVDVGLDKRIPLQLLGDGVRKFFSLIVAMYSSKDGILLVDEIDNGLHYSAMAKLWSILLETSKKFNVQLFATTHNIDSLFGLNVVLSNDNNLKLQKQVSLYKLIHRNDDSMRVLHYDYESFSTMLENENEIR